MCGIAGIINLNNNSVDRENILTITNLVSHRGPDNSDVFIEKNIALGHRRLSILDLSELGNQPMSFEDKYVIVYNGEVYNYIEIRDELKKHNYTFKTNSDTEVILASYDFWGTECVKKFNGMWSFAIYDRVAGKLFCSRDRWGVKPFYYAVHNNQFVFGSEIKQVVYARSGKKVNLNVLINYLIGGLEEYSNETFYSGVHKLNPSHNLIFNFRDNKFEIRSYYNIPLSVHDNSISERESIKQFECEFIRSINYRLRSDVKVGTCLSGGVDSSLIAAYASDIYNKQAGESFFAFTSKSSDKRNDETEYAKEVVDKCNLNWHVTSPTQTDYEKTIYDIIKLQEEPFGGPSIAMQYFVFKSAYENKCTVLLDGQGGDETMLGYERYFPAYINTLPLHKKFNALLEISQNSKLKFHDALLYNFYFRLSSVRYKRLIAKFNFIKSKYIDLVDRGMLDEIAKSYRSIRDLQILEITKTQLPHLLKYEDKNSMHFSIETRLPLLDYKLLELSVSLPINIKIKNGWTKYAMRNLLEKKVSKKIAWRKTKVGFEAPASFWLKNKSLLLMELKSSQILNKICTEVPLQVSNEKIFWRLYNIAVWEKINNIECD